MICMSVSEPATSVGPEVGTSPASAPKLTVMPGTKLVPVRVRVWPVVATETEFGASKVSVGTGLGRTKLWITESAWWSQPSAECA